MHRSLPPRTASVTAVAISDPRARRSPCANRARSHPRPRDADVCRLRHDPPLRGQWPPRVGSLALRRPCGRLVLGRRPLSCFPSHTPRGSKGGDQGPGNKKNGGSPRFLTSPPFFFPPTFSRSCPLASTVFKPAHSFTQ
jgi:hypothetical protein